MVIEELARCCRLSLGSAYRVEYHHVLSQALRLMPRVLTTGMSSYEPGALCLSIAASFNQRVIISRRRIASRTGCGDR